MLAEGVHDDLVGFELLDGGFERGRQGLDTVLLAFRLVEVVDVLANRVGGLVALVDPVETGVDERGEGEIRVARGVGEAGLDAAGGRGACGRLADERGAVAVGPRDVDGSLVARYEPLVAVDGRVRDRRDGGGVFEDAREELLRRAAQVELVVLVVEGVLAVLEQRHVGVHPRAVDPRDGFGHERRVEFVFGRDGADDRPERRDVVGRRDRVVVGEVDLVLAAGDLVVGGLDLEAHALEPEDDVPADVLGEVLRREVEVATRVVGLRRRPPVLVLLEEEELGFGGEVHVVAHPLGAVDRALEDAARVALEGFAGGGVHHVTDEACGRALLGAPPRQHRERRGVGFETHVRFLDPDEPFNTGAVEVDPLLEGLLGLRGGDGDVLHRAEDVGELEPEEIDVLLVDLVENVLGFRREATVGDRGFVCHTSCLLGGIPAGVKGLLFFANIESRLRIGYS